MFKDCNTDSIKLLKIFSATVNENEIKKNIYSFGEANFYQIGVKLSGITKVFYNGTSLNYSGGSVLYLPQENTNDIAYNKIYNAPGKSICVFFQSEYPLLSTAKIYNKCEASTINLFYDILIAFRSGNILKSKALFYSILSQLDFEESKISINEAINNDLKHIDENIFNADIDITALAEQYGYSSEYFRHKFRKEFNVSPKKYILIKRLNFAKELLLNSNFSVSDIAHKTGFSDSNYFSRYFKRSAGCTPTQFRNNGKKFL